MKKTGRRPGSQPTRREIVDAARVTFAAEGFRGATYRLIAQAADVDPALIRHYFGSKEKLFAETLEFPEGAPDRVRASLDGDPSGLGERLARAYLGLWEDLETRHQMVILTRPALTSEPAMARLRPVIAGVISQVTATSIPGPTPEAKFSLAMGQLYGVASVRHLTATRSLLRRPHRPHRAIDPTPAHWTLRTKRPNLPGGCPGNHAGSAQRTHGVEHRHLGG